MPKRPDTIETARILLELLKRIPRKTKISAAQLQEQLRDAGLERDVRSIQRQLESITEHFDIERDDRSKPYGYRWKEKAQGLSLPGLSKQEALLLTLAEQHLRNLLPAPLLKSMAAFFAQAKADIGSSANARLEREWLSKVRVVSTTQPLHPPKLRPGVFEQVSNSLFGNLWLTVTYENANKKVTKSDLMPLGLAQQGTRLYLVGRYRGFNDIRSLALHRIVSAKASTLTFERPKDFDLQRFNDEGRFGYGDGKRISLTFEIEKNAGFHLLETPLSIDQKMREMPTKYEVKASVVDSAQLTWWLRSFGSSVSKIRKHQISDHANIKVDVVGRK